MSGVNHVAGGIVFSGLYLSMFDINIYSQPIFIFFCAFFSLLPDIDHTKSLIGKVFYPIAWWLNKKYGHRTITHSLVCYLSLAAVIAIAEKAVKPSFGGVEDNAIVTMIFLWSYGSHLILDMITIQGIPLLYPFKKNPCVIPGNPDFRFRSSDFKAELICLSIFGLILFSCQDLFSKGFWNTYNTNKNSLVALNTERKMYDKMIKVEYDYIVLGTHEKGIGYLISTSKNESIILTPTKFLTANLDDHIVSLTPIRVDSNYKIETKSFTAYSLNDLNLLLKDKSCTELKLTSELPLLYTAHNQLQQSKNINLSLVVNPQFSSLLKVDSMDNSVEKELALLKLELQTNNNAIAQFQGDKASKYSKYMKASQEVNSADLAIKERAMRDLPNLKNEYENAKSPYDKSNYINTRIAFLKGKVSVITRQSINGYISYFTKSKN
jgi:inner membrane protein